MLDLQFLVPVRPWNRFDAYYKYQHLHQQGQTTMPFTVPAWGKAKKQVEEAQEIVSRFADW
jgi:hypothetical protein